MEKEVGLRLCPFCGHWDVRTRLNDGGLWPKATFVECASCLAQVRGEYPEAAISKWNRRAYDLEVNRASAHSKQVEWEKEQLLLEIEQIKKTFRTDLVAVKHDDKLRFVEHYEVELRTAQRRAAMIEEALAALKRSIEEEK
jgi:hypothetical protein